MKRLMKTNWILTTMFALALGAGTLAMTGCRHAGTDHSEGHTHRYTCPMAEHADVISEKPGDCPKCGMKLVEKK